jgi:hypothetical protein
MKKLKELIDKTYDTGKMPVKNMSLNDFRYLEYIHNELMKGNRVYYCFATEIINPILQKCGITFKQHNMGYIAG